MCVDRFVPVESLYDALTLPPLVLTDDQLVSYLEKSREIRVRIVYSPYLFFIKCRECLQVQVPLPLHFP